MRINIYNIIKDKNGNAVLEINKTIEEPIFEIDSFEIAALINSNVDCKKLFVEKSYVVGVDCRNNITGIYNVSSGDTCSCPVSIRNIMTFLLMTNSYAFYMVHNHPSGTVLPSPADKMSMLNLRKICKDFYIELLDSIILNDKDDYWFIESNEGGNFWDVE